jgi:hypothetical protein
MFTTVAAYCDPIEAQLALGLLQAEGIPARLDDTGTAIANWEWRLAIGGMRLRVPDEQVVHARRVLAALDAGEYALDDEDPPSRADTGETRAREGTLGTRDAGALQPPYRESLSSRLAWAALMLFGLPLPWRRRRGDGTVVRRA